MITSWKSRARPIWINIKVSICIQLYTFFSSSNIIHKYITGDHMLTSSYIFFNVHIFNIHIICIWFNTTYIIPNFYCTTLLCDRAIDPTLRYHKWDLIWSFIFVCSIISEHEFISDFVLVFNSFIIFTYIIFINFRLILLTY